MKNDLRKMATSTPVKYAASLFVTILTLSPAIGADAAPPPIPASAGYTVHSFTSDFTPSTVDINNTKAQGFRWYIWDMFGSKADPKSIVLNKDQTVTLKGDTTGASGELVTAVQTKAFPGYVGTSFGGGAYIEAEIKYDPSVVAKSSGAWPAFWALHLEGNITPNGDQWPGQVAGYRHSLETDFFEGMRNTPSHTYGGSMHDWYGVYNQTCGHGLCQVGMPYSVGMRTVPANTDYAKFHRYGFLWVPATQTSNGYAKFYFDGEQVGPAQVWAMYKNQPPAPTGQPWAFGVLDIRHMFLILGTGPNQPMTVKNVDVWQANLSSNLRY